MEYSFTIGLFVIIFIATVGHYVLESIKVRSVNGSGSKGYSGGLFVSKDELSSFLAIRKKDMQDFLVQFEQQLTIHTFNGREYFSTDNLGQVIKPKIYV